MEKPLYEMIMDDHKQDMLMTMKEAYRLVAEAHEDAAKTMMDQQHKRAKNKRIQLSDLVIMKNFRHEKGEYGKFRPHWKDMFRVKQIDPDQRHCVIEPLDVVDRKRERRVHFNQIKLFHDYDSEQRGQAEQQEDQVQNEQPQETAMVPEEEPQKDAQETEMARELEAESATKPADEPTREKPRKVKKVRFETPQGVEEAIPLMSRRGRTIKPPRRDEFDYY
jgi:hypothetical protein